MPSDPSEPDEMIGTTGYAYSTREHVLVDGLGPEGGHYFTPARGDRHEYIRACVTAVLHEQADVASDYARLVARCYSTPANQVTPGPAGRGIAWARRPFSVVVRPAHERGEYTFTVYIQHERSGGAS